MTSSSTPLDGFRVDTSIYTPGVEWDGCCWLDRDGTIIPVPNYGKHHCIVERLRVDCNEDVYQDQVLELGYMHVSNYLISAKEPTERQKDVLFHLANFSTRVREGIEEGVHEAYHVWSQTGRATGRVWRL